MAIKLHQIEHPEKPLRVVFVEEEKGKIFFLEEHRFEPDEAGKVVFPMPFGPTIAMRAW